MPPYAVRVDEKFPWGQMNIYPGKNGNHPRGRINLIPRGRMKVTPLGTDEFTPRGQMKATPANHSLHNMGNADTNKITLSPVQQFLEDAPTGGTHTHPRRKMTKFPVIYTVAQGAPYHYCFVKRKSPPRSVPRV